MYIGGKYQMELEETNCEGVKGLRIGSNCALM
jgi:hypothetical protein